ncbi:toll/interleukin-1 receptor domain-containing protein [Microvirga pakistanensis]|uniref:toll/interleukin-1 receptor domain-containing protein n=1 Tax=Microvirga pakistanensis TaxID=1682650 RepID=UPI00106D4780|nr:toll/interleukin-1 receptor domain-containing protein [Microvirga pakistanensis]
MANKKHVARLRKGVEAWNVWRTKNPFVRPDLSGADLAGADLIEADLSGADLTRANLIDVNLTGADLLWTNLTGADLLWAILIRANLTGAKLIGANLTKAKLIGADLTKAKLIGANLDGVDLSGTNLAGEVLPKAELGRAELDRAEPNEVSLPKKLSSKVMPEDNNLTEVRDGQTQRLDRSDHQTFGKANSLLRSNLKIVLSYRRKDVPITTDRIYDWLARRYGAEGIFIDVDSIPVGIDFREHLQEVLNGCNVLLAIIGPRWIGRRRGKPPRIMDESDWVRIEVETALQRKIPVIPVLVEGAIMPQADQLPEKLQGLLHRQAAVLGRGPDFPVHVDRLIRAIDRLLTQSATDTSNTSDTVP